VASKVIVRGLLLIGSTGFVVTWQKAITGKKMDKIRKQILVMAIFIF
jgi:hypothetical protein